MSAGNTITLSDESHVSHEHESHEPHESHNLNHTGFDSCNTSLHGSDVPIRPLKKVRRQRSALERLKWWFSLTKAKQELVDPLFWHDVLTETILCVFFNTVVVWIGVTLNDTVYRPNILHFGLFAGFFAFLCIEGWSPICGSSLNVARTFAVFLCGKMTPIRSLVYFAVEIAGGAAGAMLAKSTTPTQYHDRFHAIMPAEGMTPFNACLVEGILTANLIVIQFVVTDPKLKPNSVMGSFPVGFAVATGIMAAGTHTGGLQNPVIAMTYAMVGNNFTLHWIYWVGSMTGSAIATAFYVLMEQLRERYGPYKKPTEEPENEEGVWENYPNNNNNTADGPRKRVAATSFWLEQLSAA